MVDSEIEKGTESDKYCLTVKNTKIIVKISNESNIHTQ